MVRFLTILSVCTGIAGAQVNLALNRPVTVSSEYNTTYVAAKAVDGVVSDASRWLSAAQFPAWIKIALAGRTHLGGIHFYSGYDETDAVEDFNVSFVDGTGTWHGIPSAVVTGNVSIGLSLPFDAAVEVVTDTLMVTITKTKSDVARVQEITVWEYTAGGIPVLGTGVTGYHVPAPDTIPLIYVNQSGYDCGKPKRFTAPTLADGTLFTITEEGDTTALYSGTITGCIGDFTGFEPDLDRNFIVRAGGLASFPFRIGHWWLERVTYQGAVDFMIDARQYVGNYTEPCNSSYGWRDDTHFGWELHTLVPQFLSNPAAYLRMPHQVTYQAPSDSNLWGTLEPYDESAPDIVKLIHWGADMIVTRGLTHENLKAQLAYFLYAWPVLKQWLPAQNYTAVSGFAFSVWSNTAADRGYSYNESPEHNLLALKTKIGSTKGALPPGASVIPNLLMYEVAKRDGRADSAAYFDAAYNQVVWMITNLDWNDPQVTKGQRVSEHLTMPGLALMLQEYPDRAPDGLADKIHAWAAVMLRRSENMWDFRKLDDSTGWVPTGTEPTMWNEPGNVLGFPACLLSMVQFVDDPDTLERLMELAYAHLNNAFGRNPVNRHFSYDGPSHIEGVDLGWFSYYNGGIGQLKSARFVFDGSPKQDHYPYHPEVGNVGWTEGWVQFNVAFNISLAYMARNDIDLAVSDEGGTPRVRMMAPLNFNYGVTESVSVDVADDLGYTGSLVLTEESADDAYFSGLIDSLPAGDTVTVSYGHGYFRKAVTFVPGHISAVAERIAANPAPVIRCMPSGSGLNILLGLPRTGPVDLKVNDMQGTVLVRLASGPVKAGTHTYNWPGAHHGPGVFLVTLTWQGGTSIRKVLVW